MVEAERVTKSMKKLLEMAAPAKAADLNALFQQLSPRFELDRAEDRVCFRANLAHNIIRIGTPCTIRLQAHSLAAGVIIAGISIPNADNQAARFKLADELLAWAVSRDLQVRIGELHGLQPELPDIFPGAKFGNPDGVVGSLTADEQRLGEGIFLFALAFILLHELAHLELSHQPSCGSWAVQQENEADRFAAAWLMAAAEDHSGDMQTRRLNVLYGISVALLWLTVFSVFLGPSNGDTHPQGYDRLFQVLDASIDEFDEAEREMVWYFVWKMLFRHMWAASYAFDEGDAERSDSDQRAKVNYLINRIASRDCNWR